MGLQAQILLFFQSIHCDFLNGVAQLFTYFGESIVEITILLIIYLCVDKRKGFCVGLCLLAASLVMNIIKPIFHVARPWTQIDGLETIRQETATGYSFPSGHTTCSSSLFTGLAIAFRKRWLTILCVVMIVMIGLSRSYLCVHWPMDVLAGWVLGIGITLLLYPATTRLYKNQPLFRKVFTALGLIGLIAYLVIAILLDLDLVTELAGSDLSKNLALLGGICLGCLIENRWVGFEIEKGCWRRKILRFVVGFAVAILILVGLKELLVALDCYTAVLQTTRYFLVSIWVFGLYPVLGKRLRLFYLPAEDANTAEA